MQNKVSTINRHSECPNMKIQKILTHKVSIVNKNVDETNNVCTLRTFEYQLTPSNIFTVIITRYSLMQKGFNKKNNLFYCLINDHEIIRITFEIDIVNVTYYLVYTQKKIKCFSEHFFL